MADLVTMSTGSIHRGLILCRVLDREHTDGEAHAALRAIRHELETAHDLLSRVGADISAQRDGQAGPRASETSRAAAQTIRTRSGSQRHQVLALLAERGPLADFEMQDISGMSGNTQRPRRYELAKAGYIATAEVAEGEPRRVRNPATRQLCDTWRVTGLGRIALRKLESGQMDLFDPRGGEQMPERTIYDPKTGTNRTINVPVGPPTDDDDDDED